MNYYRLINLNLFLILSACGNAPQSIDRAPNGENIVAGIGSNGIRFSCRNDSTEDDPCFGQEVSVNLSEATNTGYICLISAMDTSMWASPSERNFTGCSISVDKSCCKIREGDQVNITASDSSSPSKVVKISVSPTQYGTTKSRNF